MLKFTPKFWACTMQFPPLAGGRGWNLSNFVLFHPPAPASGGENPCKPPNFEQKINASKFGKTELNSPTPKGEIAFVNTWLLYKKENVHLQKSLSVVFKYVIFLLSRACLNFHDWAKVSKFCFVVGKNYPFGWSKFLTTYKIKFAACSQLMEF